MARCKHCGVYIEPDPELSSLGYDIPDTCDECWDNIDFPLPEDDYSDADPGL